MSKENPSHFSTGSKEWFAAVNPSSRSPKLEIAKILEQNARNIFQEDDLAEAVRPFLRKDTRQMGEVGINAQVAETFSAKFISTVKHVGWSTGDKPLQAFGARLYIGLLESQLRNPGQEAPITTTRKIGEEIKTEISNPRADLAGKISRMKERLRIFEEGMPEREKEQTELLAYAFRLTSFERDRLLQPIKDSLDKKDKDPWRMLRARVKKMKEGESSR